MISSPFSLRAVFSSFIVHFECGLVLVVIELCRMIEFRFLPHCRVFACEFANLLCENGKKLKQASIHDPLPV
jgi:hypothetical protein